MLTRGPPLHLKLELTRFFLKSIGVEWLEHRFGRFINSSGNGRRIRGI